MAARLISSASADINSRTSGTALNSRRLQAFRQEGQLGGDCGSTAETNLPEMGEFPSLYYTLLASRGRAELPEEGRSRGDEDVGIRERGQPAGPTPCCRVDFAQVKLQDSQLCDFAGHL